MVTVDAPHRRLATLLERAVGWLEQASARGPSAVRAFERQLAHPLDVRLLLWRANADGAFILPQDASEGLATQLSKVATQLGAPLPPSLKAFWVARRESGFAREVIDALWLGKFHEPEHYLELPRGSDRHRLSVVKHPPGFFPGVLEPSWADARQFAGSQSEYARWYRQAEPKFRFPSARAWRTWPVDKELGVLLPPRVVPSLIDLAYWNDNLGFANTPSRFLVSHWRDGRRESPVFAVEDGGAYAWKRGNDVVDFLGNELDFRIAHFSDELE